MIQKYQMDMSQTGMDMSQTGMDMSQTEMDMSPIDTNVLQKMQGCPKKVIEF